MSSGGPYLYVNVTEGTVKLPRHDGTGVREVRPGEGFYGPAFYDRYVLQCILARQFAEIVTMYGIVQEADMIPRTDLYAGTYQASFQSYVLPPWRFQRAATTTAPYYGSQTTSCLGLPKYQLSFPLAAKSTDPVSITYFFYASSTNPTIATHKIQQTEVMGSNWTYPSFEPLTSTFYTLPPQDQVAKLMQHAP